MLQHEYVRERLTEALFDYQKTACNQIVVMASMAQSGCKFQEKPFREVSVDGVLQKIETQAFRCSSTRGNKSSSIPVSPNTFRHSSWRRAIKLLPSHYQAWVNYSYGDSTSFENQEILAVYLWTTFQLFLKESGSSKMKKNTAKIVKSLIWLAVQESKNIANRGEPSYRPADLKTLAGVNSSNWSSNYQPKWQKMLGICQQLDREALINVELLHKKARRERS